MCVDSGSYMINFVRCSECKSQDMKIVNRNCTEIEDEERINYQRKFTTNFQKLKFN